MRRLRFILPLAAIALAASCGCGKAASSEGDPSSEVKEPSGEVPSSEPSQEPSQEPSEQPAAFTRYNKDMVIHSDLLDTDLKYSVYLPAGYEENTAERYPVVYMLHGYGDDNNSWNGDWLHASDKIKTLESSGLRDMIYVYPTGFQGYYVNKYDGSFNYMDMFVREFIPHIDATLRTVADKQHRCITGWPRSTRRCSFAALRSKCPSGLTSSTRRKGPDGAASGEAFSEARMKRVKAV